MDELPEGEIETKKEYVIVINALLTKCNDLDLLDFIFKVLQKNSFIT